MNTEKKTAMAMMVLMVMYVLITFNNLMGGF